jgi:hypothetical protein
MTINPNLSVYRVPFTVSLSGAAFVIAESPADARRKAERTDLGDYLNVEDNEATIDPEQGELVDFGPVAIPDDTTGITEDTDYPVEDHPDYDPSEHDEPADEVAPPRPEGLRS